MTPSKVPNFNSSVIRAGTELQICPAETVQEVYNKIFINITYLEEKNTEKEGKYEVKLYLTPCTDSL